MRRKRYIHPLVLLITIGAAACGGSRAAGEPAPLVIRPQDRGMTVSVRRGQHLVLLLSPSSSSARPGTWTITTYPRPGLALLTADAHQGRFEFRARAIGSGKIIVATRLKATRCVANGTPACQARGGPGLLPLRPGPFVLFVRIVD